MNKTDEHTSATRIDVEYVLPLKWSTSVSDREADRVSDYLEWLSQRCSVTVIDGSPPVVFTRHAHLWGGSVRHIRPAPWPALNGKVTGVVTGVRTARHEWVVVADDDVQHTDGTLGAVSRGLELADLVRPQNVFSAWPWHARWDTGRTLLNRCFGVDHPGTLALRRSTFLAMGGYDGDVMFENLELVRTVVAHGGRVLDMPGVFVPRLPPTTRHFLSQRVRQAYDSLAQPSRLTAELLLAPTVALLAWRAPRLLPALGALLVAAAESGRRRNGGAAAYPTSAALWAVPWAAERAVCSWLALLALARGGIRYGDTRIRRAASSRRALQHLVPLRGELAQLGDEAPCPQVA